MDKKIEDWQTKNKDFCEKADTYQRQILYITEGIIESLEAFKSYQKDFNKDYLKIDINRLINKLARIRTMINSVKWKDSK